MILSDFLKALGQIDDRAFRGVLLRALGLTILLLGGFVWGTSLLLGWLLPDTVSLPWIGDVTFIETLASGLGVGAALILSIFLMVPVASLIIGVFLEVIAAAVETKHYPALPSVGGAPFLAGLSEAVRFLGLLVGAAVAVALTGFGLLPGAKLGHRKVFVMTENTFLILVDQRHRSFTHYPAALLRKV